MSLFTPSLKPTFKKQAEELFHAEDIAPLPLSPELNLLIESLHKNDEQYRKHEKSWWFGSLHSVRDLLWKRTYWNVLAALAVLLSVVCMQRVLTEHNDWGTIILLTSAIAFCELVKHGVGYFDRLRSSNIMRGVQTHLMILVNRKLVFLDPKDNKDFTRGNLKTLVSADVESIEDFISAASTAWIPTFAMFVVLTPIVLINIGWLGLIGIATALVQIPITICLSHYIAKLKSKTLAEKDALTTVLGEWVKNIRLVRFLSIQPFFNREIERVMSRYCNKAAMLHTIDCVMWGLSHNWWMFGLVSILVGSHFLNTPLELNSFLPSCWALLYMMANFNHIPYSISLYAQAAASRKRMNEFFACPELVRHIQPASGIEETMLDKPIRIHLNDLSFSFGDKKIFNGLNLTFDLHKRTAIVGTVGSGKTTLLELLVGEIHPQAGTVEVEYASGIKLPLWSEQCYRSFRERVAYSPQSPYLSNAKFHQNVSLTEKPDADKLGFAVEKAQLKPDIAILKNGLEEEVGETGINLSGGQKQRVSMARAFYSERPLFVLDDPLSAVDRQTELTLLKDILECAKGLVLVSHRLEELHTCDRLIVLEHGAVVEDGKPDALISDKSSRVNEYFKAIASTRGGSNE